jgi:hypothetical protein
MKELNQQPGVRRWHGDELVSLQAEVLEPLQKMISELGNCILEGCYITFSGATWTMSAGIIGCKHADGFKIVRIAAQNLGASPTYPKYLYVVKSTLTKLYDDGNVKTSALVYEGAFASSAPGAGLFITIPNSINAIRFKNLLSAKDNWHNVGTGGEPPFLNGFGNASNPATIATDVLRFKKNSDDLVTVVGAVDYTPLASGTLNVDIKVCTLPIGYRPLRLLQTVFPTQFPGGYFGVAVTIQTNGDIMASCTSVGNGYTIADLVYADFGEIFNFQYYIN